MTYLVLEVHRSYAIVLDSQGRFLKVANMNYDVGQELDEVMTMASGGARRVSLPRGLVQVVGVAACLLLFLAGSWQVFMVPQGSVQMTINPKVEASVNRFDRVIGLKGLNGDGTDLIAGIKPRMQKIDAMTLSLADQAVAKGYLEEGGQIHLILDGKEDHWGEERREGLEAGLEAHFNGRIRIVVTLAGEGPPPGPEEPLVPPADPEPAPPAQAPAPVVTPAPAPYPGPSPQPQAPIPDDDWDDDDWDDDGDDD